MDCISAVPKGRSAQAMPPQPDLSPPIDDDDSRSGRDPSRVHTYPHNTHSTNAVRTTTQSLSPSCLLNSKNHEKRREGLTLRTVNFHHIRHLPSNSTSPFSNHTEPLTTSIPSRSASRFTPSRTLRGHGLKAISVSLGTSAGNPARCPHAPQYLWTMSLLSDDRCSGCASRQPNQYPSAFEPPRPSPSHPPSLRTPRRTSRRSLLGLCVPARSARRDWPFPCSRTRRCHSPPSDFLGACASCPSSHPESFVVPDPNTDPLFSRPVRSLDLFLFAGLPVTAPVGACACCSRLLPLPLCRFPLLISCRFLAARLRPRVPSSCMPREGTSPTPATGYDRETPRRK